MAVATATAESAVHHNSGVAALTGETVFVAVQPTFEGGSYGYTVVIDHGAGLRSIFYGLTALDVEAGDDVKQGQLLGTSGRTVVAELRIGTVPINPLLVWRGQCDGLKYY